SGHVLGPGERLLADSETVSALTSTYLSKRAQLVRFFTVRTSSSAEAEDIVQEIFMKIAGLDSAAIENHAAFLYKLGTNVMLDRVRSKRRSEARESAYFDVEFGDGSQADPAASAPSPEDAWQSKRRLEEVMRVLDSFPPQRHRVFTMHKIDGQSYSEVAQALGISKSAVEKHMMAALKQLAEPGAS
ncbi:MAG: RNA polymerase sigma factor, partial [Terricaulis sp.]